MREPLNAPRAACQQFAPTLALLDALHDDAWQAAQAHLAGCAWCQADQRAYSRFDVALRNYAGPAAGAAFSTANLLANIGATVEPHAASASIRSVRYVKDFDDLGGMETMSETEQHDPATTAGPERKVATIPNVHLEARLSQRAWAIGFSATAAALVLIVVAVSLFGSHWRLTGSHATATPTASAHGQVFLARYGPIVAISMDSPTDGWALGDGTRPGGSLAAAGFYHFDGSHWRLAQTFKGIEINGIENASVTMFSRTDGWAFNGLGTLFHYDGTSWQATAITTASGEHVVHLIALDVVSPTEGWAAAYMGVGATGAGDIGFLHYTNQQWTVERVPTALPGVDVANLNITGISALPGGDVWAVGVAPASGATGGPPATTPTTVALVFHRVAGVWQVANRLTAPTAGDSLNPRDIYMSSPTSGWIVGDIDSYQQNPEGYSTTTHALLMRFDGTQWTQVSVPINSPTDNDSLFHLMATGPNNIWVEVRTTAGTVMPGGLEVLGELLHYDGSAWSAVSPTPSPQGIVTIQVTNFTLAPDGSIWSAGSARNGQNTPGPFICSFRNGTWTASTFSASK